MLNNVNMEFDQSGAICFVYRNMYMENKMHVANKHTVRNWVMPTRHSITHNQTNCWRLLKYVINGLIMSSSSSKVQSSMVEYLVAYGHVTWLRSNHWCLLWRRRVSQTGSLVLVVHSTYVQLPGKNSICRRLSGHKALDNVVVTWSSAFWLHFTGTWRWRPLHPPSIMPTTLYFRLKLGHSR